MTAVAPAPWIDRGHPQDDNLASDVSDAVLRSENPYIKLVDDVAVPQEEELIRTSALLAVRPDLRRRSFAGAIALDEYRHYIAQTYFFEVLGVQLVGHLAALADSLALVHEMGRQAIDESRHAEAYGRLYRQLGGNIGAAGCIGSTHRRLTRSTSLTECLVDVFVVLESLAVGLFGARITVYQGPGLSRLDRQILAEEGSHQHLGAVHLATAIRRGSLSMTDVTAIARRSVGELQVDMLPLQTARSHGVDLDPDLIDSLAKQGILGAQTAISRGAIRRCLTNVSRLAKS